MILSTYFYLLIIIDLYSSKSQIIIIVIIHRKQLEVQSLVSLINDISNFVGYLMLTKEEK